MSTGNNGRGGAKPTSMNDAQRAELIESGLIGRGGGLTRKGSILWQQLHEASLELFG